LAVKVAIVVLVGPDIPPAGLQVYPEIGTVEVIVIVTVGGPEQVMLGDMLLIVKVGALLSGDIVATCAAEMHPLAPMATTE
jgi:hypothetical protein